VRILFLGDIFGSNARKAVREDLPTLREKYQPDFCIANGENAASGRGVTRQIIQEFQRAGLDAITMGNHTWAQKEFIEIADECENVIVPANMPSELPGMRKLYLEKNGMKLCVVNMLGRVGMEGSNCPFETMHSMIEEIKSNCKTILVDFHGEATSEKAAFAWEFDGRIAAVLGTHTHVQTADERILDFGTGFITDVGMCGPYEGIIGSEREDAITKLKYHYPVHLKPAKGKTQINAVVLDVDEVKGQTRSIERVNYVLG